MGARLAMIGGLCGVLLVAGEIRPAQACGCLAPGFQLLSPSPDGRAPRNARVRVAFASTWQRPVEIILRRDGRVVPTRATRATTGSLHVIELTAAEPLAADTSYDVVAIEGGRATETTVVGGFRTGATVDSEAPSWAGVDRAVYVVERATSHQACQKRSPYAVLTSTPASDDLTGADAMLYAIWLPDRSGRLDLAGAPSLVVPMDEQRLWLGSGRACDPLALAFPRRSSMPLAVAAVDAAGNRSESVRVTLRLGHPARRAP